MAGVLWVEWLSIYADIGIDGPMPTPRLCRHAVGAKVEAGPDTAASLLITAGDNLERLRSKAAWAHLCGVSPIQASSGKVTRHRLNRGGDRQANSALWRIVMVRLAHDPETKAYLERRVKEGRNRREVIRILKRYVAREVYRHLPRG
jgi:transposase